jgi:hypothetical protein
MNITELVGKPINEAKDAGSQANMEVTVAKEDGVSKSIQLNVSATRVLVEVVEGKVVRAWNG